MIYLDNNATTMVAPEAAEAMVRFATELYGNPSVAYRFSRPVREAIAGARAEVAALIGAEPDEIAFTGCGTEANNAAIFSALRTQPGKRHLVTSAVEHSAIKRCCEQHAPQGVETTYLPVDPAGRIDLADLDKAIRPGETALVSLMWANNETGVLSPVEEAAALCREKGVLFHSDAIQAAGKIPIDVAAAGIPMLSISGHKFHAPKGVGALYVSKNIPFQPLLVGGGQEGGRRSGTENVPGIAALGIAAKLMRERLAAPTRDAVRALRDRFENALLDRVEGAEVNGHPEHRLPTTANLHFPGAEAQGMLILLGEKGICCSSGSACSTGNPKPSAVMTAMGYPAKRAKSSLRFSFSRYNTDEEIGAAVEAVAAGVKKLRALSGYAG